MSNENFYLRVYEVVRLIPSGRVTSYGAIAECLGTKASARMIGYAMKACGRIVPPVPAHRVVNRNGMLTGKHSFATPDLMQQLLENEGITIENDKVVHFNKIFWHPGKEAGSDFLSI